MPTYEYACTECGDQLEVVQSFTDDALTICPNCQGKLRKVFSPVGVVFKGSGFYKTDSRASRSNGAKANGSGDSGKSSESGSDSAAASTSTDSSGSSKSSSDSSAGSSSDAGSKSGADARPKSSKSSSRDSNSKGGGSKVA
jgi:putative FmdB family regulatory protein